MIIQNTRHHRIIITPGEPAGIGPDVIIQTIQKKWPIELVICADPYLLLNRAKKINLPLILHPYDITKKVSHIPGTASILSVSLNKPVTPGQLDINNNTYVINTLFRAIQGCLSKEFSALVTGPINKIIYIILLI